MIAPLLKDLMIGAGTVSGGLVLGELAAAEKVPIQYYLATFVGLSFVLGIIKAWTWFEDREKKARDEMKSYLLAAIKEAVEAHDNLDLARTARIETLIANVCIVERSRRTNTPVPLPPPCGEEKAP